AALTKAVAPQVARDRAKRTALGGAEVAWLAIAADVLARADNAISLNVAGRQVQGPSYHAFSAEALASPVVVRNDSKDPAGPPVRPVGRPVYGGAAAAPALAAGGRPRQSRHDPSARPPRRHARGQGQRRGHLQAGGAGARRLRDRVAPAGSSERHRRVCLPA